MKKFQIDRRGNAIAVTVSVSWCFPQYFVQSSWAAGWQPVSRMEGWEGGVLRCQQNSSYVWRAPGPPAAYAGPRGHGHGLLTGQLTVPGTEADVLSARYHPGCTFIAWVHRHFYLLDHISVWSQPGDKNWNMTNLRFTGRSTSALTNLLDTEI